MGDYRLESEWQIDATVDRVWDILLDVGRWPTWWRGFRSADRLADGEPSGRGMRIRQGWRGWLPYTLVIDLEIVDLARHRLVQGRASGDMAGTCTWTLEERDGRTVVRFVMEVRTERWWMNLPVPFAGKVVAGNFHAIMAWGAQGLERMLAEQAATASLEVGLAGA